MADHQQTEPAPAMDGSQLVKLGLELGPLVLALIAYAFGGFYWATGTLMVAMVAAVVAHRWVFGRFTPVLIATTLLVLVFGSLTLWLRDPSFIKMKPTIVNAAFAALLAIGLATDRLFLKYLLGEALKLTDEGWRRLTWRWAFFFVALALANEFVWRNFSDSVWWGFKVAIVPITVAFFACQWGLIQRHQPPAPKNTDRTA